MKVINANTSKHLLHVLLLASITMFMSQGFAHELGSNKKPIVFGSD